METFGQKIRDLRHEKGLTQTELANLFHIDKSTIAKYETDKIEPKLTTIIEFARFFNVTTDYLLGLED